MDAGEDQVNKYAHIACITAYIKPDCFICLRYLQLAQAAVPARQPEKTDRNKTFTKVSAGRRGRW